MHDTKVRLVTAALAECFAVLVFLDTPFVFSGDSTRYVKFVAGQLRDRMMVQGLFVFAVVICIRVLLRGSKRHRRVAALLIAIPLVLYLSLITLAWFQK